jgi:hypothetical protein
LNFGRRNETTDFTEYTARASPATHGNGRSNENRWIPHLNKSRKGKANQSKVNATTDRTDDTDDTDKKFSSVALTIEICAGSEVLQRRNAPSRYSF